MTLAQALPLSREHVATELGRLLRVHKRPQHAPDDPRDFAIDYAQICAELTTAQFTGAVDAYLKSDGRFFPKPGELLALGKAIARAPGTSGTLEGQYFEWERNAWHDPVTNRVAPCPVCQEYLKWHVVRINADGTIVERQMVLHNGVLHQTARVPFTGRAMPGTAPGSFEHYELKVVDRRPPKTREDGA